MLNIINNSFKILKNNLLFIQPLLLFILILLSGISYIAGKVLPVYSQIILLISFTLLFVAFISGWFYINKLAVNDYNTEDTIEECTSKSINNFKKFFEGIGASFLKMTLTSLIILIICLIAGYGIFKFCWTFFGEPTLLYQLPKIANAASQAERLNLINSIPIESQITIAQWFFTINTVAVIATFIINMYYVIVLCEKENIFKSGIRTLKFIFSNLWNCILIILFLQLIYIVLNIISMIFGMNIIALFITIMLFTMYLNYGVILLFCFYNEKSKNNSNNRSECVGEN